MKEFKAFGDNISFIHDNKHWVMRNAESLVKELPFIKSIELTEFLKIEDNIKDFEAIVNDFGFKLEDYSNRDTHYAKCNIIFNYKRVTENAVFMFREITEEDLVEEVL